MARTEFAIRPLSLGTLDDLQAPEILCFVGSDERPLTALAGFVDWRLCGALTRQVRSGLVAGSDGESLLTVPGRALPARRVFVAGIGKRSELTEQSAAMHLRRDLGIVARAGGIDVATTPPGWGLLPPATLIAALVEAALAAHLQRLWLLVPDVHATEPLLRDAAQRRGAHLVGPESPGGNLPGSAPVLRSMR